MEEHVSARRGIDGGITGRRHRVPSSLRWKDQKEKISSSFSVSNWRRLALSGDAWKVVLRQAQIRYTGF